MAGMYEYSDFMEADKTLFALIWSRQFQKRFLLHLDNSERHDTRVRMCQPWAGRDRGDNEKKTEGGIY